jgi:hypothetical protein
MPRPKIWDALRVRFLRPGYEFRSTDGAIRNHCRHVLTDHWEDMDLVVAVETFHGLRLKLPRKDLIARSCYGPPPRPRCPYCGLRSSWATVQINGQRTDCRPENLAYVPVHEHLLCLANIMRQIRS